MRSPRPVSTGLTHGISPLFTCGMAASSSHGVSLVDARRGASRVQIWVQPKAEDEGRYAAHSWQRPCCNTCCVVPRAGHNAAGVTALLSSRPRRGTEGQRIRESGDTGDNGPRQGSPKITPISAGQAPFGDSGDSGDTFSARGTASALRNRIDAPTNALVR
jgi:hypothetical protein